MKNFMFKLIAFACTLFACIQLIFAFIPFHWGNQYFSTKFSYLETSQPSNYNLFFFGSSRVNRQIAPFVFDSIIKSQSSLEINSFNLGSPATFCPQNYYLYEKFLESNLSSNTKFCLVELMPVTPISTYFFHQEQTNYWINFEELKFIIKSFNQNKKYNKLEKEKHIRRYIESYIESFFHIGHLGKQLLTTNFYDYRFLGERLDGYYPMGLELRTVKDEEINKHLIEISLEIKKDSTILNKRFNDAIEFYNNKDESFDSIHLNRILNLLDKSSKLGIKTIFFISPRSSSQELINLFNKIPKENKIDMANPYIYKEFYLLKYAFDRGHLNEQGAKIYSEAIANEFLKLIEVEKPNK
jgi:hypothetical protein